jgi:PucR family transcriptional regulator, proline-responsive transcriptional activator
VQVDRFAGLSYMGIRLNTIAEQLKAQCSVVHQCPLEESQIICAKLLQREMVFLEPGVIYIGRISDFPVNTENSGKSSFALLVDSPDVALPSMLRQHNILFINGITVASLLNLVQDILSSESRYFSSSAKLLESLVRGKGIQNVVDIASMLLQKPMFVRDTSFKLLAHTKNIGIDDVVWNNVVKKGYHTYEDVKKMMRIRAFEKLNESNTPVRFESSLKPGTSRVWSKICIDDTVVGHLVVLGLEKKFSDEDMELVQLISNAISLEMRKDGNFYSGLKNEGFVKDLLAGKVQDREEIQERLRYLDCKFGNKLCILTAVFSDADYSNMPKFFIKDYLSRMVPDNTALVYKDDIVIIISHNSDKPFSREVEEKLVEFLTENHMTAGLSYAFVSLTEMNIFYNQSLKAIELGRHMKRESCLHYYENYLFEHMLSTCSEQKELHQFCHPSIFVLREYDRNNNTNHLKFLYQYLGNINNPRGVISALNIHRNTLKYRLDKIKGIMNVDLKDSKQLFLLYLSLQILRYKEGKEFLSLSDHI